jgi:hypothetical protein
VVGRVHLALASKIDSPLEFVTRAAAEKKKKKKKKKERENEVSFVCAGLMNE